MATILDLITMLDKGEWLEIGCPQDNDIKIRVCKKVRTGHVIRKDPDLSYKRGLLVLSGKGDAALEHDIREALIKVREHAGRKTGESGI